MADLFAEVDSEGVYLGMSLEEFGVRVSGGAERAQWQGRPARGATTVPKDQLRESIQHLKEELTTGAPLSGEDRARLDAVLGEVAGILDAESDEHSLAVEFFDDLREFAERFEESHPKVALVLGRIADSLSQLGI